MVDNTGLSGRQKHMSNRFLNVEYMSFDPQVVILEVSYLFMKNFNYLIIDPVKSCAVIVDPAWEMQKIDKALSENNVELKGVLITHTHPDHINLAKPLSEKYDCPLWMSQQEINYSGFSSPQLIAIDSESCDENSWNVGNLHIQAILTPGHTPGCVCYLIGDNLFTGDVLFAEGCGLCPDVSAAHDMYFSLETLKQQLSPRTKIYPGHSYGKYPGQLFENIMQNNIYLQLPNKDVFATFRMRNSRKKISR